MPVDDFFRRTMDLNLRFYASIGILAADYLRDFAAIVASSSPDLRPPFASTQQQRASYRQPRPAPGHASPTMVFEAEAGQPASGVFLVENHLAHTIAPTIAVSKLTDPSGNLLELPFVFDPASLDLKPREQVFVRATVVISASLAPEVSYSGQISIPELAGTSVPIVVRRRA